MRLVSRAVRTMVVSFANRNTPLRASILLLFGLSPLACGGSEFGDFQGWPDADAASSEASAPADTSVDGDWSDMQSQDGETFDTAVSPDATVPPDDVDDGGVAGCEPGEEHDIAACSNCGRYVQVCNNRRTWDP